MSDGEVRRGHTGLTGEVAHVLTVGPGGRAVRFIDVFGELGLRRAGSTAIDTERLLAADGVLRATVDAARVTAAPVLAGVRAAALDGLRAAVTSPGT